MLTYDQSLAIKALVDTLEQNFRDAANASTPDDKLAAEAMSTINKHRLNALLESVTIMYSERADEAVVATRKNPEKKL